MTGIPSAVAKRTKVISNTTEFPTVFGGFYAGKMLNFTVHLLAKKIKI